MNRNRISWSRDLMLLLLSVMGVVGWAGCRDRDKGDQAGVPGTPPPVAMCPDQDSIYARGPDDSILTEVPLAGKISLIAGFHDCQRLVSVQDTATYGPLAVLWVAESLDALPDSVRSLNSSGGAEAAPGTATVTGIGLAFATVYSWHGPYSPLGIGKGWNCLFVFPAANPNPNPNPGHDEFGALMAQVEDPSSCLGQARADTLSGKSYVKALFVHSSPGDSFGVGDYPPVGRWELDKSRRVQFIGLGCHDRWCAVTDRAHLDGPVVGDPGGGHTARRVWRVPGWFDEQPLADTVAGGGLRPGRALGTVVPDSSLNTMTVADFKKQWKVVARAALNAHDSLYKQKLNLDSASLPEGHGPPQKWAELALCTGDQVSDCFPQGGAPTCDFSNSAGMWWERITAPDGAPPKFLCVRRVDHSALGRHIPGVVRWVWDNKDEKGNWFGCPEGCCQSQ